MQTFTLPKHDGTNYTVKGTALTKVFHPKDAYLCGGYPRDVSVIQLASGEKILYVRSAAIPRSNSRRDVKEIYRNAQDFTAQRVCELVGSPHNNNELFNALGIALVEEIA